MEAKVMCSMKDRANKLIKEHNQTIKEKAIEKIYDYTSPARLNIWYIFLELEYSFQLLCAGIELRHP